MTPCLLCLLKYIKNNVGYMTQFYPCGVNLQLRHLINEGDAYCLKFTASWRELILNKSKIYNG